MPEKPQIGLDGHEILIAGQEFRPRQPLIIPGRPGLEWESANRLGLLEPLLGTEDIILLTGRSNPQLAKDIARCLNFSVDFQPYNVFCDGESHVRLKNNVRGKNVYIVQTTARSADGKLSVNDAIMDAILMVRAADKADAEKIRLIIPYFGYSRQDKRNLSREPVSASDVAQMFMDAGANSILTMDIHSGATEGSTKTPMDILYGTAVLLPAIKRLGLDMGNVMVISPDAGGAKRAQRFSELLGLGRDVTVLPKDRQEDNKAEILSFDGRFDGKDLIIPDDIGDTCGTLLGVGEIAKQRGARTVTVVLTHGLFSDDDSKEEPSASKRILQCSGIDRIIVTDTIAQTDEIRNNPKVKIVTVAPLLAEAIKRIHLHQSVSSLIPMPIVA
jgi:ribose-phosphate pyrophosphokinase